MTKRERTRQFIIERAAPIINKKGMAATTLNDIMETTKLAKGGIYGNFENKEEICTASFDYLANQLAQEISLAARQGRTAREKFFNILHIYQQGPSIEGGCPLLNFGVEADDTNPEMTALVKARMENAQKRLAGIFTEGIRTGELKKTMDAGDFSIKTFAVLEGGLLISRVYKNNTRMESIIRSLKTEFDTYLV